MIFNSIFNCLNSWIYFSSNKIILAVSIWIMSKGSPVLLSIMIFFFQCYAHQFSNSWRNDNHRWKGNTKCKCPWFEPDMQKVIHKSDIKNNNDQRHKARHQKRHKKCKHNMLIFSVYHCWKVPFPRNNWFQVKIWYQL